MADFDGKKTSYQDQFLTSLPYTPNNWYDFRKVVKKVSNFFQVY